MLTVILRKHGLQGHIQTMIRCLLHISRRNSAFMNPYQYTQAASASLPGTTARPQAILDFHLSLSACSTGRDISDNRSTREGSRRQSMRDMTLLTCPPDPEKN